mmetsp:Transcript_26672/g.48024  ORF Transcript_26672/g.48024 Transcript_26672/m.48024 type:complete len:185 (+) Transcript_26672:2-556(+)
MQQLQQSYATEVCRQYTSLNFLSMSGCGLTSLANFPNLGALLKLDLSKNSITGGLDNLSNCVELMQLSLTENQIKTIDSLQPLANLPNLLSLELEDNPVAEVEGYREKVFELCSSLEVLDGLNVEGQEVSMSEEEGSDEDFSPDSDFEDFEEEEEDESFDSEEEKPKRKRRGGDPEPQPRKHKK